jgi:hypothetical protein
MWGALTGASKMDIGPGDNLFDSQERQFAEVGGMQNLKALVEASL